VNVIEGNDRVAGRRFEDVSFFGNRCTVCHGIFCR
jgi:hypothetical protein